MKRINAQQLKLVFESLGVNPRVVASGNFATPHTLLSLLDAVVPEYRLHMLNAQAGIPDREGVSYESAFVGPGMRRHRRLQYVPSRLSLVPVLFRDHYAPDIVLLHTSSQRHDTVSLGTEVNILPAAIEAARARGALVIAQANPQMPYTYGDAQIYENEIDYLIEVDEPLSTKPVHSPSEVSAEIGRLISAKVTDGSTLQLGIGEIPDAVIEQLHSRRNLRIFTEMFSDGVLGLHRAGALDPEIAITASFIFGSRELYDWLHLNRGVRMLRTEKTNDPGAIARQAKMTSINAALEVDLFDQANASRVRGEIYSGWGGSTDFIVGALHSRGGQSFMALPSWHAKANVSTIVPRLTDPVTSFQHSYVVTEQGVADCFGHSQTQQAQNIISRAAHPSVRDELTAAAGDMGLL
jgi:acyl-CoA hydrolase